jgi:hypothetical protein
MSFWLIPPPVLVAESPDGAVFDSIFYRLNNQRVRLTLTATGAEMESWRLLSKQERDEIATESKLLHSNQRIERGIVYTRQLFRVETMACIMHFLRHVAGDTMPEATTSWLYDIPNTPSTQP